MQNVDILEFQWLPGNLDHLHIHYWFQDCGNEDSNVYYTLKRKFSKTAYILH